MLLKLPTGANTSRGKKINFGKLFNKLEKIIIFLIPVRVNQIIPV
jgi:hypothetical protein